MRRLDGVLLLDKPAGITSNAALQRARRALQAAKAGHTGTLDPLASGLLPICFGEATKFAGYLLDAPKGYTATIRFGAVTSTGDADGEILRTAPVTFDRDALARAVATLRGPMLQVPPRFSALKHQGRPLHDYARAGIDVPREPRPVTVHALDLVQWQAPDATVEVRCSKGTYVRVLAEDLGEALGCGAHLAGLRRTASGGFSIDGAIALATLEAIEPAQRDAALLPVAVLLDALPRLDVEAGDARRFAVGGPVAAGHLQGGACAVFAAGTLLGVGDVRDGLAHPRRVVVHPG